MLDEVHPPTALRSRLEIAIHFVAEYEKGLEKMMFRVSLRMRPSYPIAENAPRPMRGTAPSGVCENLCTIMTNNGAKDFTLTRTNQLQSMIFQCAVFRYRTQTGMRVGEKRARYGKVEKGDGGTAIKRERV